jgi:multiple antibiotic resistance protein
LWTFFAGVTAAAAPVALTVWIAYSSAGRLVALPGASGARVAARLAAFLLLCIGVQILSNGVQDLLTPVLHGVAVPRSPEPEGVGRRSRPNPTRAAPTLRVP